MPKNYLLPALFAALLFVQPFVAGAQPKPPHIQFFETAEKHRKAKQFEEAVMAYSNAFALNDTAAYYLFQKGLCQLALKDVSAATATFEEAATVRKNYHEVYQILERIYRQNKQEEALVDMWKRSSDAAPDLTGKLAPYHKIVNFFLNNKRFDKALAEANEALELFPDDIELLYLRDIASMGHVDD